jgi:hypothetical protein
MLKGGGVKEKLSELDGTSQVIFSLRLEENFSQFHFGTAPQKYKVLDGDREAQQVTSLHASDSRKRPVN